MFVRSLQRMTGNETENHENFTFRMRECCSFWHRLMKCIEMIPLSFDWCWLPSKAVFRAQWICLGLFASWCAAARCPKNGGYCPSFFMKKASCIVSFQGDAIRILRGKRAKQEMLSAGDKARTDPATASRMPPSTSLAGVQAGAQRSQGAYNRLAQPTTGQFSTGLSSGDFGSKGKMVMFAGTRRAA